MGTTLSSIHIYSTEEFVHPAFSFRSFSPGWQTYLPPSDDFTDPEETLKIARKISKAVDAPVLWFYEFDSDVLLMRFYLRGKQVAAYSGDSMGANKNLYGIPQLVGYEEGNKRRLSKILSCSDVDCQIELLEEFFGVCLLPFPELLEEDASALARMRGDRQFREYLCAEKELTGKRAPIQVELVQEMNGVLSHDDFFREVFPNARLPVDFKEHYYLYREANYTGIDSIPAIFRNGKLEFISVEEMKRDGIGRSFHYIGENPGYEWETNRLIFSESAPPAYAKKTMTLPRGLCGLGFDGKNRLVLYDDRNTFAIVDEELKMIAKQRLKGNILDLDGEYILTVEEKGGIFGTIRVYHVFDK